MNAANTALDIVGKSVRVTRDELESQMEAAGCDARVIGSTISTLIRRGELAVDDEDRIALGDEDAIEQARQERESRKQGRDRPPPRDEITPTQIRDRIVAFVTECKHGVKARGVVEHMNGYTTEANVWYHLKQLVSHQQLRKAGQLYMPPGGANSPVEPNLDATEPTAPIVDVQAACAEAEEQSRPTEQPSDKAPPETGDPVTAGQPEAATTTLEDIVAKHSRRTADSFIEAVTRQQHGAGLIQSPFAKPPPTAEATVGGIQITIRANTPDQAARMLAAALAAIQP